MRGIIPHLRNHPDIRARRGVCDALAMAGDDISFDDLTGPKGDPLCPAYIAEKITYIGLLRAKNCGRLSAIRVAVWIEAETGKEWERITPADKRRALAHLGYID